MTRTLLRLILFTALIFVLPRCSEIPANVEQQPGWPAITSETKPWTRWWWHGSAVTKEGITSELESFRKAGIGGVEITPIYGVYGYEDQFVPYLSPQWTELLMHVLTEADRLGLGVDMATGTGWPFGGPWVTDEDACKTFRHKTYEIEGGNPIELKIEFIEEPYLRLVGNQRYEVHDNAKLEGRTTMGTRKEPVLVATPKNIRIEDLKQPVHLNQDLQTLAIDQVQFKKQLPLHTLMAFSSGKDPVELTSKVDATGVLHWQAPAGSWTLYAVFTGWHGKMVERAGPGGEGNVIDHFSTEALDHYLQPFDKGFEKKNISSLRAFFNDSYEVDDARGAADFTPGLFEEFKQRMGYNLKDHLPALFGNKTDDYSNRIRSDYRETISQLVLENFTTRWRDWAHKHDALVRNQAHGSPANILDLYGVVDIPEIEGVEPLRFKMASSSGNVMGKKLISAEAATWLNEHFKSNLSDIKGALDKFLLNGVNHLVYHGTAYSPPGEPWPGWLFYAAIHANPRNPLWHDFDALNAYVARAQSFLQSSTPDNDILLYYPFYDPLSKPAGEMIQHFDGIGRQLEGSSFANIAETLHRQGYQFDFVSDRQVLNVTFSDHELVTQGGSRYKTIIIPKCEYMPLSTIEKMLSLARDGATVIVTEQFPEHVTGYKEFETREHKYEDMIRELSIRKNEATPIGKGSIILSENVAESLKRSKVLREEITGSGLSFIRKKMGDGKLIYFVNNPKPTKIEGWISLNTKADLMVIYDPMTGQFGKARTKSAGDKTSVFLQLAPGESIIIESADSDSRIAEFAYAEPSGTPTKLTGKWTLTFSEGGPELPPSVRLDSLKYWTDIPGESYQNFSGRAIYSLSFKKPEGKAEAWEIRFENVNESAEVIVNGRVVGTMLGPVYSIKIPGDVLLESNKIEVHVSNLMANRIACLDRQNVSWKKFYNINFPARRPENIKNNLFNASEWPAEPSGVTGTVSITPLK